MPRVTFENTVSMILEEGHVKSMRTPRRACMKRLMSVAEAKEVCRTVAFGAPSSLAIPQGIWREGLHLAHTSQAYVFLQVRKSDNQSNVDAVIHKVVPSHQFQKLADTARKQFKNYKQFKIKSKDDDKELESVVFAIQTKDDSMRQNGRRDDNLFSFENIKQKFIDFFYPPDNNDLPNLRAKMEKYNIKPQIIHFRDGKGKPSMMYEVESKSLLQTIKNTIASKTFKKYAEKFVQKAALVFRTLKEELNKN